MPRAHILVIDDEPGMLRAVERILSSDHQVTCCATAAEAAQTAARLKPDLVICDVGMPGADGYEVMSQIKRALPDLDVILMTGLSDPDAHMIRAIREKAFYFIEKPFNRDVMRTLVDRCLELRRLRDEVDHYVKRVGRELAEARALQETMLPEPSAVLEGVRIGARCVACSELGGDTYDYAAAGAGRAAVMVADVAGHGVSAALLTAVVKSAFGSSSVDGFEPLSVVRRVARDIAVFSARRFVTLFVARIDRKEHKVDYVNAGHPAGLLRNGAGAIQELGSTGPLISPAFGEDEWEQASVPLQPDFHLLLYTDGITEAAGETGQFSRDRLIEQVRHAPEGGEGLLESILTAVQAHCGKRPQHDDLTLLSASIA